MMKREGKKHQSEALLHEHRKIIFKLAAAFTRQPQDRQDLAQETAIQL